MTKLQKSPLFRYPITFWEKYHLSMKSTRSELLHKILTLDFFNKIYWGLPIGETLIVKWPKSNKESINVPNELWRPWLEENVGYQNFNWGWRICKRRSLHVEIKFRNKLYASQFILMFGVE